MEMSTHGPVTLKKKESRTESGMMSTEPQRLPLLQSLYSEETEDPGQTPALQPPPTSQPGAAAALAHAPNLLRAGSYGMDLFA